MTTSLSPQVAALGMSLGLLFSLGCYLITNLSPGGMITPAWLAITLVQASWRLVDGGSAEVAMVVEDARHKRLRQAAKRGPAASGERIHAPIAGKVVKALVAVGDTVAAGQPVIVLEAMKMENELAAERGGTVHAVHKTAGQSVDTGELLVELT